MGEELGQQGAGLFAVFGGGVVLVVDLLGESLRGGEEEVVVV